MPPKYPFSRNQPSGSSSSNPNANANANTNSSSERPVVVSASGRAAPNSPAGGADSPATLRARNISPRTGAGDTFASESSAYPSPTAILKSKAKGRKDWLGSGSGSGGVGDGDGDKENNRSPFSRLPKTKSGWLPLAGDSPGPSPSRGKTPTPTIQRYNARGNPSRGDGAGSSGHDYPPEGSKSLRIINGLPASESHDSLASFSSTGAGVDEETNRFLSNSSRPMSYYTSTGVGAGAGASASSSSEGHTPSSAYPPLMNYSLAAASYDPYDNPANGNLRRSPEPGMHGYNGYNSYNGYNGDVYNDYNNNGYSGYGGGYGSGPYSAEGSAEFGQSRLSLNSMRSEGSLTHFRKHDALNDSYGAFSISSKGGKKHLADMVSYSGGDTAQNSAACGLEVDPTPALALVSHSRWILRRPCILLWLYLYIATSRDADRDKLTRLAVLAAR